MFQLRILFCISAFLLSGCHAINSCDECWWYKSKDKQLFNRGMEDYVNGNYESAVEEFNGLVRINDVEPDRKVQAYKYLAFIHCVTGKERLCNEEFKNALVIDHKFTLIASESGHPIWGPVFRNVKSKFK